MVRETDTLIVGAGIAGLTTALMLNDLAKESDGKGHRITVITKGLLRQSNTYWAQGGIAAVMSKEDSFDSHFQDTIEAGAHHNDEKAVHHLVEQAPFAFRFLRSIGVDFQEVPVVEGAHSYPRVWRTSDFTGQDILNQLIKAVKKEKNIDVREETDAARLIVEDGECFGAFVRMGEGNELEPFLAKNTILATGGCGRLFAKTTNTAGSGGDGLALALQAGLALKDMEFMQFHPTAFAQPDDGRYFLLSESLRGFGARITNHRGEEFLRRFDERGELAPRDLVSRAVYFEMMHGPVYLDMNHIGSSQVKKAFPNIYKRLKKYGFDLGKDPVPITPAAHYLCGGIPTDLRGATKMPGLFAVGEVACTGVHGANRLASNSLLEAIVFSKAVRDTLEKSAPLDAVKRMPKDLKIPEVAVEEITQVKAYGARLGQIMWEHVGLIRTMESLEAARREIALVPAKDYRVQHRQMVCQQIVEACLKRPESLGTHYMARPIL